jgi:ubiquitin-like 1-activating enzyme E1 B
MGSDDFSRKVFEKVFTHDINRLRSMEDMWKTRKPPQALDYDQVAKGASSTAASVAQLDQIAWTLSENYIVFQDRY